VAATGSRWAADVLAAWLDLLPRFVRVMPREYARMQAALAAAAASGLTGDEAALAAFRQATHAAA
jgi:glutamate synthase (ferredoxin)